MRYLATIILIYSFGSLACQRQISDNANQPVKPPVSATAAPSAADKSKIKTYDGMGVITKINLDLVSVELKHEEIKGLMPAMQMEFYVNDKKTLNGLQVGDKVEFVLEDNAGAETIIKIKKL